MDPRVKPAGDPRRRRYDRGFHSRARFCASASWSEDISPATVSRFLTAAVRLRLGVALLGGEAIPARRLGVVLRHAAAFPVHHPEREARGGVALVGGKPKPLRRFGVVLRDAAAAVIGGADDRLGARLAGLGERARKLQRLGVVGPLEGDLGGARLVHRARQAHRHGAIDEGLLDRMAVDAERKARRHGDERDIEAPLELGLVRATSEQRQKSHAK